jgi:hypothetical protein
LAYVGLTRARNKAHIYYALRRQVYGDYNDTVPSRFIDEIPPAHIDDQRKNMQQKWLQQSAQVQSINTLGRRSFNSKSNGTRHRCRRRSHMSMNSIQIRPARVP